MPTGAVKCVLGKFRLSCGMGGMRDGNDGWMEVGVTHPVTRGHRCPLPWGRQFLKVSIKFKMLVVQKWTNLMSQCNSAMFGEM